MPVLVGPPANGSGLTRDGVVAKAGGLLERLTFDIFQQTDSEAKLSTEPKTRTRWERGKVPQSKAADQLADTAFETARAAGRQVTVLTEAA